MERVDRHFAALEIRDPEGRAVRLGDLWSRGTCVLVFVRQFGCVLCRQQAAEWKAAADRIGEAGAGLALIGSGSPAAAKAFREDLGLGDVQVYSDEARRAFVGAGFRRGLFTLLSPRAIGSYIRAFLSGYRAHRQEGDAFQQGGVLAVRPDGAILFRHASRRSGDHADVARVIEALRAASPVPQR